ICESSAESRGIDAGILAHSDLSTQARSGSKTLRDLQHRPEEVTVAAQPVEGRLWREAEPARLGSQLLPSQRHRAQPNVSRAQRPGCDGRSVGVVLRPVEIDLA